MLVEKFNRYELLEPPPVSSVVTHVAIGAGRPGFDSKAGDIGHTVATTGMFFRSCVVQALSRRDGPVTRYTHTSIMKI